MQRKRIAVIGGGPAGMEAARRLALRGHSVVLLERGRSLGGTLQLAALAYPPNQRLLDWLRRQIAQSAVEVRLRTAATPALLRALAIDEVVVATGAAYPAPTIPGSDLPQVLTAAALRALLLDQDPAGGQGRLPPRLAWARRLLRWTGLAARPALLRRASALWLPFGDHVAIIGGGLVALELAELLALRGRLVTVLTDEAKLGAGLQIVRRWRVLHELGELGVSSHTGLTALRIEPGRVTARGADGRDVSIPADQVVIATGAAADPTSGADFAAGFTIHRIGDCADIGHIGGAMAAAARVAAAI